MLTREQIEEIQGEAREKGTAIKALLKEKGIPEHQYFWWKRKYARAEVPEGFLPIAGGGLPAGMDATANDYLKGVDEALRVSKRTIEMDLRDMEDIFQIDLDESKVINGKKAIRYADEIHLLKASIGRGDKRLGCIQHLIHAEVEPGFLDDPFKLFGHLVGDKADTDMCLDAFFGEVEDGTYLKVAL